MFNPFLTLQERADQLARSKDVLISDIKQKRDESQEKIELLHQAVVELEQLHGRVLTT